MRPIDADALREDLIHNRSFFPVIVKRAIEDAPTIDTVEVVRCGECKRCENISGVLYCYAWGRNTIPNGYCHEGV